MHRLTHRFTKILTIIASAVLLVAFTSPPENYPYLPPVAVPSCANPEAHLELSMQPTTALTDTIVTLNISYVHIGLPYTYISIFPEGLVTYEPPLTVPCKYSEHPSHCTAITFRTQATGVVQFHAGATGELWDEVCHCWCMGSAQDDGPATLVIAESISRVYLPSAYR
jgi:endo-1,4-beta-xylanase